ncbi:CMRF35-like molecule 9 isoform X4 [Mastomys coucha]|uniref:CMRF35-like molecule 9 isoform X4 n=1 Tax=Mastomys coucha TaxID=35658 RepID=UPI0012629E75|nr:CMRF35-like molecule 9 isoform X4 [Mastomys coucha]
MRPLVLLWGCLVFPGYEALKGPKEISGFEGDTVSLQCTYEEKMKGYRKYWCQQGGILLSRCGNTVYTNQDQEVTRDMMSIRDSPEELSMTVTMRDLTLKDSGKYWCGIDRLGRDNTFEVTLIVFPGSSRPAIWLPITPQDSRAAASSVSKPSVSIPMVRMMAPVLILLSLLLAAGLIAFGTHMLRWRRKAWLATETQKNEKVYLETSPPGISWTPEDSTIDLAVSPECLRNLNPSAVPSPETQNLSQFTEEEAACSRDAEEDVMAPPPLQMSVEELACSEFISV